MLANSPSLAPRPVKSKRSTAMPRVVSPSAMRFAASMSLPQVKQCANSANAIGCPAGPVEQGGELFAACIGKFEAFERHRPPIPRDSSQRAPGVRRLPLEMSARQPILPPMAPTRWNSRRSRCAGSAFDIQLAPVGSLRATCRNRFSSRALMTTVEVNKYLASSSPSRAARLFMPADERRWRARCRPPRRQTPCDGSRRASSRCRGRELRHVDRHRLARHQVDRDRVGGEGVEHDQVVFVRCSRPASAAHRRARPGHRGAHCSQDSGNDSDRARASRRWRRSRRT